MRVNSAKWSKNKKLPKKPSIKRRGWDKVRGAISRYQIYLVSQKRANSRVSSRFSKLSSDSKPSSNTHINCSLHSSNDTLALLYNPGRSSGQRRRSESLSVLQHVRHRGEGEGDSGRFVENNDGNLFTRGNVVDQHTANSFAEQLPPFLKRISAENI